MGESTADSTAAKADSLRLELNKTLTKIIDDGGVSEDRGGSFGVLKAIDEAINFLSCLRGFESKNPDISSSSQSPKVEVPKEFICTLSYAIMSDPVVIASGQTYEKRYITEWLRHERTCPKTKEVLSHRLWAPNRLIDWLITKWCELNKYDRPEPSDDDIAIGLFSDDIDKLLQRVSSPSSLEDQTEAAKELRRQTKRFPNVRAFFVAEIPDSITRLLSPLSALVDAVDLNPELQKNIITALFYISIVEENKIVVAKHPLVIPLLTKSLNRGTAKTRNNSAAVLFKLSAIDSNKIIIGNSETLKALIDLIKEGDFSATIVAATAVFNLCLELEYREKAVSEGLVPVVTNKIKAGSNVDQLLHFLTMISTHNRVIEEMEDLGFIDDLFSILRKPGGLETGDMFSMLGKPGGLATEEHALAIVIDMCGLNTGDRNRERTRLKVVDEENKYGTFTKLARQGSNGIVRKAEAILQWLKRCGTGEEPQRG